MRLRCFKNFAREHAYRLELRPEAIHVPEVEEDEHARAEVEKVDVRQHPVEVALLCHRSLALVRAAEVKPHPPNQMAAREVLEERLHLRARWVRVFLRDGE